MSTDGQDEHVIEIENLVKRFGDQTVLDGISLDVKAGETMVIMGGSVVASRHSCVTWSGHFIPMRERSACSGRSLRT